MCGDTDGPNNWHPTMRVTCVSDRSIAYAHSVMVVSFLGLALTGLPLKFSDYRWAQWLAALLGGFASTGVWHRVFSISMFGCFFAYVLLLMRDYFVRRRQGKTRREVIFGPDSPLPNLRDATGPECHGPLVRGPRSQADV